MRPCDLATDRRTTQATARLAYGHHHQRQPTTSSAATAIIAAARLLLAAASRLAVCFGTPEAGRPRCCQLPYSAIYVTRGPSARRPPARLNIPLHTLAHLRCVYCPLPIVPTTNLLWKVQLPVGRASLIRIVSFGQESVHHCYSAPGLACRSRASCAGARLSALSLPACCRPQTADPDRRLQTAAEQVQRQSVSWHCRSCVAAQPQARRDDWTATVPLDNHRLLTLRGAPFRRPRLLSSYHLPRCSLS